MSRPDATRCCCSIRLVGTTKCPELNAQENVWQFIRDNWLSNRVFDNMEALLDHCSDAWNKLEAQPWTFMSIGLRDWAHRF